MEELGCWLPFNVILKGCNLRVGVLFLPQSACGVRQAEINVEKKEKDELRGRMMQTVLGELEKSRPR